MKKKKYKIRAEVWLYPSETAAWHFVSVPKKESEEIKKDFGTPRRGWGSVPVSVTVGKTTWETSIFPDKKAGGYILPIKSEVRKKEGIRSRDNISFLLKITA